MTLDDFYAALEAALPAVQAGPVRADGVWPRLRVTVRPPVGWTGETPAVTDPLGVVYYARTGKLVHITRTPYALLTLGLGIRDVRAIAAASDWDPAQRDTVTAAVRAQLWARLDTANSPPIRR